MNSSNKKLANIYRKTFLIHKNGGLSLKSSAAIENFNGIARKDFG